MGWVLDPSYRRAVEEAQKRLVAEGFLGVKVERDEYGALVATFSDGTKVRAT